MRMSSIGFCGMVLVEGIRHPGAPGNPSVSRPLRAGSRLARKDPEALAQEIGLILRGCAPLSREQRLHQRKIADLLELHVLAQGIQDLVDEAWDVALGDHEVAPPERPGPVGGIWPEHTQHPFRRYLLTRHADCELRCPSGKAQMACAWLRASATGVTLDRRRT